MARPIVAALTAACSHPSEGSWPQMLKGESRPAWLPIVRSQKVERPGSSRVCAIARAIVIANATANGRITRT